MPDASTPTAAATTAAPATTGVTPSAQPTAPAADSKETKPMDRTRAGAILRQAGSQEPAHGSDPLSGEDDSDPLNHNDEESDPLFSIVEAAEEASAPETAAEEVVTAEATPETVEQPPAAEAAEEQAQPNPDGRKRLNINRKDPITGAYVNSAQDRAILQLMAEEGISIKEATRQLYPEATTEAQTQAAPAAKPVLTAAEIETQIRALRDERKLAAKDLDSERQNALTEQIEDLMDERHRANQRETQAVTTREQQANAWQVAVNASVDQACTLYPESGKEGTPLHGAIAADLTRLEKAKSPLLQDPDWPELLTAKHAARLGIAPAKASTPAAAPKPAVTPAVATAPKRAATPSPAPGAVSSRVAVNEIDQISKEIAEAKAARDLKRLGELTRRAAQLQRAT